MIQQISVNLIDPHPQNPRKDLGDLTELTASIAKNGIFQNLTVIPAGDRYTVIIGHRRLAAAKLAGLETVPCIVTEMNEKEQLSTMLLENMQRNDLTIAEEAFGFQLMFDIGIGVEEIAEQTGFSQATVKKRLKIATLPEKNLKEAMARGGTLEDYIKIAGLKDEKAKKKLLNSVGTNNFNSEYFGVVREEKIKDNRPRVIAELNQYAEPSKVKDAHWSSKWDTVLNVHISEWKPGAAKPKKIDPAKKYFYEITTYDSVYVLVKAEKTKAAPVKKSPKEREANRRREALKEITSNHRNLRIEFMKNYIPSDSHHATIITYLANNAFGNHGIDYSLIQDLIGQKNDLYRIDKDKFKEFCPGQDKWRIAAIAAYAMFNDCRNSYHAKYYRENYGENLPEFGESEHLNDIYGFLIELGYEMSDEELAMKNGSHELFGEWRGKNGQ